MTGEDNQMACLFRTSSISTSAAIHKLTKRVILRGAIVALALISLSRAPKAFATPSTTFWTPMTEDCQPFGVVHLGIDNYFRLAAPVANTNAAFPTDMTSPTIGVLPFKKFQMETGVDYFANTPHPWLFNAKACVPEGSLFKNQPAFEIGAYDAGKKFDLKADESRLDFDVAYVVVGKTIPKVGRVSAGPYVGNHAALVSSDGKYENVGFMAAFDHSFVPVTGKDGSVEYSKVVFAADYQSGKNALGAAGAGFYYYFTSDISLLVGPTFFNDKDLNGSWRLSTQLDINLPKLNPARLLRRAAK